MKAQRILIALLIPVAVGLVFTQWRLQRAVHRMSAGASTSSPADNADMESAEAKLRRAEAQLNEAKAQLESAEAKVANANAQIAQLDNRLRQLEAGPRRPRMQTGFQTLQDSPLATDPANTAKRGWGPEQAAGEPNTFQAGDISTAWAPLEQDGGEEWLKLDYETSVDIAEMRVRETHNPGAISKITAFLASGTEVTLWEGTEPKADAPVEMSFRIPDAVNAKSVKVYLDTTRIPGWNEIDAVELIGRDGSHQWAKQASASSTYAEPRVVNRERGLQRFE